MEIVNIHLVCWVILYSLSSREELPDFESLYILPHKLDAQRDAHFFSRSATAAAFSDNYDGDYFSQ